MDKIQPKGITQEQFKSEFTVKANDVPRIEGKPTYATLRPLRKAVERNLMAMLDDRDPYYGRLHLIGDTSQLPNGPSSPIPKSTNKGPMGLWSGNTGQQVRENYYIEYYRDQERFLSDHAAEQALKELIMDRIDEVYIRRLRDPHTYYKNVSLKTIVDALKTDYPASPEERREVVKQLEEQWDPNEHIEHLFDRIKDLLEELADMRGTPTYTAEDFVEYTYMSIKMSRQFDKDCEKWKNKPAADRATEAQCRTFFRERFTLFDAQRDSMHDMGVANNAELQGAVQINQDEIAQLRRQIQDQQFEIASLKTTEGSTVVSQLTAMSAQQQQQQRDFALLQAQNQALQAQLAAMQQQGTTIPPTCS